MFRTPNNLLKIKIVKNYLAVTINYNFQDKLLHGDLANDVLKKKQKSLTTLAASSLYKFGKCHYYSEKYLWIMYKDKPPHRASIMEKFKTLKTIIVLVKKRIYQINACITVPFLKLNLPPDGNHFYRCIREKNSILIINKILDVFIIYNNPPKKIEISKKCLFLDIWFFYLIRNYI